MIASWTAVLGATLLVTTVSSARSAVVADAHRRANTAEHTRWVSMGDVPVHKAAHLSLHAVRELSPLAAIDPGASDFSGPVIWLEAHRRNDPIERPANRASEATRLSSISTSLLLQLVLPLIVIMAGYASVSGEREQGTLAMAVASGLSIRVLVAGKLLALVLGVCATIGIIGLWSYVSTGFDGSTRLLVVLTLLAVYALLFVCGTVLVSSRARSSRAALALLLVTWLTNGMFLPRLGASVVETILPLPSARTVRSEIERAVDVLDVRDELERRTQALMTERRADRGERPIDPRGLEYLLLEDASNAIHDEKLAPLLSGLRSQTWWYQWTSVASPQVAVLLLSQALAGTDVLAHLAFVDGAERYRRDLQRMLSESIMYSNQGQSEPSVGNRELWRRVPTLITPMPPLADIVAFYWPALLALVVWTVVLGGVLWRTTGRATTYGA